MRQSTYVAGIAAIALLVGACGKDGDSSDDGPNPFAGFESAQYEELAHWLCHPDLPEVDNVCHRNLDATVVHPDGSTEIREHVRPENPEVDCHRNLCQPSRRGRGKSAPELSLGQRTFINTSTHGDDCSLIMLVRASNPWAGRQPEAADLSGVVGGNKTCPDGPNSDTNGLGACVP